MWGDMLEIGLPAGAEFALMGVYMAVVYAISRAVRRGGAGGLRHRPARDPGGLHAGRRARVRGRPVAGQNFGARPADRVRATFRIGALMATVAMMVLFVICRVVPERR